MLRAKSLLVVEDDYLIAELLREMLDDLGCTNITVAHDVPSALKALDDGTPDIVLLDLNLNGKSASPIAQRLRDAQVPFVISSDYSANALDEEWRRYPLLTKPYSAQELGAKIDQAFAMDKL